MHLVAGFSTRLANWDLEIPQADLESRRPGLSMPKAGSSNMRLARIGWENTGLLRQPPDERRRGTFGCTPAVGGSIGHPWRASS
jgi:hypothetical protein